MPRDFEKQQKATNGLNELWILWTEALYRILLNEQQYRAEAKNDSGNISFNIDLINKEEATQIIKSCGFVYQPIIDFIDISSNKSEMLVRYFWEKYSQKDIHPGIIMQIVDSFWLQDLFSEILVKNTKEALSLGMKVSINLLEEDFTKWINRLRDIAFFMDENNIPTDSLTIEVLETIKDISVLQKWMEIINQLWFNLFIDDFWAGFNWLDRLESLITNWIIVNWIKLDKKAFADKIKVLYWEPQNKNWVISFPNLDEEGLNDLMEYFSKIYHICAGKNIKIIAEWIEWDFSSNEEKKITGKHFSMENFGKFSNLHQFCCFIAEVKDKHCLMWSSHLINSIQWFAISEGKNINYVENLWLLDFNSKLKEIEYLIWLHSIPIAKFWESSKVA